MTSSAASSTGSSRAVFQVVLPGGLSKPFGVEDLKRLPIHSITSDGQPQEGPALQSVLAAAGVTDFSAVTVTGSNGKKTLTRAQVTSDLIFDYNNRGGVKLVSPSMPKPQRIVDVNRIDVTS